MHDLYLASSQVFEFRLERLHLHATCNQFGILFFRQFYIWHHRCFSLSAKRDLLLFHLPSATLLYVKC
jgi:hypothetical protein